PPHLSRCAAAQSLEILAIHGQYQVEPAEVPDFHHTRPERRHIVATAESGLACSGIRGSTNVISRGAGRIDLNLEIGRIARHDLAENHFSSGRTADVAETDEQDFHAENPTPTSRLFHAVAPTLQARTHRTLVRSPCAVRLVG